MEVRLMDKTLAMIAMVDCQQVTVTVVVGP